MKSFCLLFSAVVFSAFFLNCSRSKKPAESGRQTSTKVIEGKQLFTTHCVSCHAIEAEEIGPRLGGVTRILSEDQLLSFIKNPNKTVEAGDKRAVSLMRRYKMIMPPFDFLADHEIREIVRYIGAETNAKNIQPLTVDVSAVQSTDEPQRLIAPISKSALKIELEDYAVIPPSSDKMPRTRIATMRAHPSQDGSLFVSDQRGIIYRVKDQKPTTFLDIRPLIENYVNEPGLGTGLGSFAFHPDYLDNGLIYITHTESFTGKKADYEYADSIKVALQWVVSEWKMDDVKSPVFKGNRRELLRINMPGTVHGTQDIGFAPDLKKGDKDYGMLYIGTGDGSSTISGYPQLCHHLGSLLGTIIRIDPLGKNSKNGNYGIPSDNPFVNQNDQRIYKEIYAYGFRNPHRLSWHKGTLISTEVGESNFEEINLIEKGGDYGWNAREGAYGISFKDLKNVYKLPENDTSKLIKPFAAYDHYDGAAISGGAVYEGPIQALQGKYFLADIVSGKLFYVDVSRGFKDPSIHELSVLQGSQPTNLNQLTGAKRVDVRVEYNRFTKEMFIMTKPDGKIRRVAGASEK